MQICLPFPSSASALLVLCHVSFGAVRERDIKLEECLRKCILECIFMQWGSCTREITFNLLVTFVDIYFRADGIPFVC